MVMIIIRMITIIQLQKNYLYFYFSKFNHNLIHFITITNS